MREDVVGKALELLRERAFSNRCLERFSAVIVIDYHDRIKAGDNSASKEFLSVAANIGYNASSLYKMLTGNALEIRERSLYGNKLEQFIMETAERGYKLLASYNIS